MMWKKFNLPLPKLARNLLPKRRPCRARSQWALERVSEILPEASAARARARPQVAAARGRAHGSATNRKRRERADARSTGFTPQTMSQAEPLVKPGSAAEAAALADWQPVKPVALPPDENVAEWSTSRVGSWLMLLKLDEHVAAFAAHRVTGDVLEVLSEAHLLELGVRLVGQRVLLMREIQALRRTAVNRQRFRVLWQANSILYHRGCMDWGLQMCCCVPCCEEPDHYKLTASTIVAIHRDHTRKMRFCCPVQKLTRQIDLTSVVGVSALHTSRLFDCGCAADHVMVDLNHELGLEPVAPLLVEKGSGAEIAQMIQLAMEEAQANEFGGVAPRAQAIARY